MDLSLHFPCVYPLIKQAQQRFRIANHLLFKDVLSSPFALQNPSFGQILSKTDFNGDRRRLPSSSSSMVKSMKSSDDQTSNPSKPNKEEIIALFKRIKASISKEKSQIDKEKNLVRSSENDPMTKAVLEALEKSRKKIEGDTEKTPKRKVKLTRPLSSLSKRSPIPSAPDSMVKSNKALEEMEEEKASLIETMKVAELKEIAKNKGIKGYSKLKKTELLELLKSS